MDKYGTGQDPYCYPGSRVLRNRLDIRDEEELEDAERELTLLMWPPSTVITSR